MKLKLIEMQWRLVSLYDKQKRNETLQLFQQILLLENSSASDKKKQRMQKINHFFANRNASVASTIVRSNTVFELACQQYITIEFNFTQEFDLNSLEIMGSRTIISITWLFLFLVMLCCAVLCSLIKSTLRESSLISLVANQLISQIVRNYLTVQ